MECNNTTVIHSEDCEKPRIKEECLSQDEITGSQTTHVQKIDTHFIKCVQSSDMDTKVEIKQETLDPDVASSDIKRDPNQPSMCLDTVTIKDDKIDINQHDIQEEVSPDNKTHKIYFMEYNESSDARTKTGIKQEALDPHAVSGDIKCDSEQPFTSHLIPFTVTGTLKAADEMDIKEELYWVEGTSADSLNEGQGSGSRKNKAPEEEPLLASSRLDAQASKFNCLRSGFTRTYPKDGNNYCLTSKSFHKKYSTVKEDKRHKCSICDLSYTQLWNLKRHKLIHEGKKPHKCDVCDKSFAQLADLKKHKLIHDGKKPHKCNVCGKSFTQKGNLKVHKMIHEGKKLHKCDLCDKSFTWLGNLKVHKLHHEGKKSHNCDVCDKSFAQLVDLKTHKLIHDGKKPHKCNVCNKSFTRQGDLKTHKFIHEGKKPHKCDVCDKSFTRRGSLKSHKLIHAGKRPHKCDVCDMSFTEVGTLKRHKFIHEGEKPHKCDVCDKNFRHLRSLKIHKLIHEDLKPHKCDICDKSFTWLQNLKAHNLIHEGILPHKCDDCDKSFTKVGNLKRHKLIHKEKQPTQM